MCLIQYRINFMFTHFTVKNHWINKRSNISFNFINFSDVAWCRDRPGDAPLLLTLSVFSINSPFLAFYYVSIYSEVLLDSPKILILYLDTFLLARFYVWLNCRR